MASRLFRALSKPQQTRQYLCEVLESHRMAWKLRSTFQRDAFREGIWPHALPAVHGHSVLSFVPGTWGTEGGAAEGGLGSTAFVRRDEGSKSTDKSLQNYTKTRAHEEIYKSFSKCLRSACSREAGCFRHLLSEQILQLELSPYINRIISPPLRPVSGDLDFFRH
jgi:hypothetical protein